MQDFKPKPKLIQKPDNYVEEEDVKDEAQFQRKPSPKTLARAMQTDPKPCPDDKYENTYNLGFAASLFKKRAKSKLKKDLQEEAVI